MTELRHRTLAANGIRIHAVEAGEGPLVLFVHGFPECWYSWRHQLPALAEAGYHAVAIDARGYGRSSAPTEIEAYRTLSHVADNLGVLDALGADHAVVVGHDWGAPTAWSSALLRPDRFRAVAGLSLPYSPRSSIAPLTAFRAMAGDEEFYMEYFQEPGRAEAEFEGDVRAWLQGFYLSVSGAAPAMGAGGPEVATIPAGGRMRDRFVAAPDSGMPDWLDDDDLDVYVEEFERTGITGALNRYRNLQRDWEDLAVVAGRPITVPSMFIGGSKDGLTLWGKRAIDRFPTTLPGLTRSVILEDCGHWIQQERSKEVSELLVAFLDGLGDP